MNLKATLTPVQNLRAVQNIGGNGGSGSTTWNKVKDKPFETLGEDFTVENGALEIAEGVVPSLDGYATEEYVDNAVAAITPTIPVVSATSTLSVGTQIGSITVDGETTTFYAPDAPEPEYPDAGGKVLINSSVGFLHNSWGDACYFDVNQILTLTGAKYLHITYMPFGSTNWDEKRAYKMWGEFAYDPNDPTSFTVTGWESILDRVEYDETQTSADKWRFVFKPRTVYSVLNAFATNYSSEKQNINAYFIPVDNDTIKVNSDGELYAEVGGTTDWSDIDNKPFNSIGAGLEVVNGKLKETVPIGDEIVTTEYDWYWCLGRTDWTYDAQADAYIHILTEDEKSYMDTIGIYYNEIKYQGNGPLRTSEGVFEYDSANNRYVRMLSGAVVLYYYPTTGELVQSSDERYSIYFDCGEQVIEEYNLNTYPFYETETVFHELDADYINIDNDTIISDGGVLKAVSGAVDWSDITDKPTFATVATSGDYDDLRNKPTIPQPTEVTVTQTLQSGTKIADIDVDGITTTLYAPTPTVVGITNTLSTGTAIGDLEIDGVTTTLYAPQGGSSENTLYKTTEVTLASGSKTFTSGVVSGVVTRSNMPSGQPLGNIFTLYETGDNFDVDYTLNDGTEGTETLYYVSKIGVGESQYSTSNFEGAWVIADYKDSATIPYNDINQMSDKLLGIFKISGSASAVFLAKASSGNFVSSISCGERILHQVRLTIPVKGGLKATDTVLYAPTIAGQGGIQVSESAGADYSTYNLSIAPNAGIVPLYLNGNGVRTSFGGGLIANYPGGFTNISSTLSNNNTTAKLSISSVSSGKYIAYIGIVPSTYTTGSWNYAIIREIIVDFTNNTIEGAEEYIASYSKSSNVFTLNTRSGWAFTKNISTPGSTGWRAIKADNNYPLDWSNKFEARYIPIDETTLVRNSEGRISSAIPAPPTTDGTYTLQVVVSNGTPTYSWI